MHVCTDGLHLLSQFTPLHSTLHVFELPQSTSQLTPEHLTVHVSAESHATLQLVPEHSTTQLGVEPHETSQFVPVQPTAQLAADPHSGLQVSPEQSISHFEPAAHRQLSPLPHSRACVPAPLPPAPEGLLFGSQSSKQPARVAAQATAATSGLGPRRTGDEHSESRADVRGSLEPDARLDPLGRRAETVPGPARCRLPPARGGGSLPP